jgi:hypothetical protein
LRSHLIQFVRPVAERLAAKLDIRLVQTALDLVQVILTHRHRALGLLLTELGGYLLSPAQAPAGAKRISNLIHAPDFSADDIGAILWQQARERVQALEVAGEEVLLVWDGSVWEKPESQANEDWCVVRSAKAGRLSRRRKGMTIPHNGPPLLVPGLHWEGLLVVGMDGPPTRSARSPMPGPSCWPTRADGKSSWCGATAKANWRWRDRECGTGTCGRSCCC